MGSADCPTVAVTDLNWDLSASLGVHRVDSFVHDTINASLGLTSPDAFDIGRNRQREVRGGLPLGPERSVNYTAGVVLGGGPFARRGAGIASPTTTAPPAPPGRPSPCSRPPSGPARRSAPSATTSTATRGPPASAASSASSTSPGSTVPSSSTRPPPPRSNSACPPTASSSATSTAGPRHRSRCARSTRSSGN